ncbi:hypothetical protein CAJAP_08865 [Camponotus japonicus]
MDHIHIYPEWKRRFFDILCIVLLKLMFMWNFQDQVRIPSFVNIERRQLMRTVRRARRSHFAYMWGDTPESRQVEDIFDLRQLFGEEPHEEIEEQENWTIEEEEQEEEEEREEDEEEEREEEQEEEEEREEEEEEEREEEEEEDGEREEENEEQEEEERGVEEQEWIDRCVFL